jgi:transcription elongation factor GreA
MKFFKITVFSFFALAACGSLRAQDLRGVVRDAENQPLVGASVYWAGTTIGASTDAQGAFLLHRVKGYDKLVAELKQLESVERPKASAAIAEARDKGDLSENAEYDAAKEAQAHLEEKINRIKVAIAEAKILDPSRLSTDCVQILSKVEMTNLNNKAKMTYTIVSESEANLREGKISITTPIAQGLLNHKVGDEVEIKIPRGIIHLRIDKITIE